MGHAIDSVTTLPRYVVVGVAVVVVLVVAGTGVRHGFDRVSTHGFRPRFSTFPLDCHVNPGLTIMD